MTATALRAAPDLEQTQDAPKTDQQKAGDLAGAACEAIAALEAIGEMGCFDNLPKDEADHDAHDRGAYLLQMIERTLRSAVRDFDGSR